MGNVLKNKIMIVDDDESVIFPIEMTLQERGLQTISFNDGEQVSFDQIFFNDCFKFSISINPPIFIIILFY